MGDTIEKYRSNRYLIDNLRYRLLIDYNEWYRINASDYLHMRV